MTRRNQQAASTMFSLGLDAWSLYFEASTVIGLRMMKMAAGGPGTDKEMALMIGEKVQSAIELQLDGATGKLGTTPAGAAKKVVRHYKRKVGANRRRLSR
jgi:hypothetical protein